MRSIIISILLLLLSGCSTQKVITIEVPINETEGYTQVQPKNNVVREVSTITESTKNILQKEVNTPESTTTTVTIPSKLDNPIDFVPQAPYADWDEPYDEACEEASLIMGVYGLKQQELDKQTMKEQILKLVDWEDNRFGYFEDTNADEIVVMAQDYFGMSAHKVVNPTVNQIKKELADGNMVIAVLAGQEIHNPYFQQPGPLYHALVIRGYNSTSFITNDPGTRRGEGFKYDYDTIMSALHDWNHGDVYTGEPVVIVIEKE